MHNLQLFIVKKDKYPKEVETKVEEFLRPYQDIYYDWYEIGGTWDYLFDTNVVTLKEAIEVINNMTKRHKKRIETLKSRVRNMLNKKKLSRLEGYTIEDLGKAISGQYSGESMIYNLEREISFNIPDDIDEYMVVIVDLHN